MTVTATDGQQTKGKGGELVNDTLSVGDVDAHRSLYGTMTAKP